MAFEKACSLQAPTTEAEVNELIDFTFAELNRRAETSESVVPFYSSEASSSELQRVSIPAASDDPTGERLYMSMTEEGPSGDYKITMPTKGERTMNIQKAREERRSFYVGEGKEHGTFSIQTQFSKAIETKWQGVLDFKAVTIIDSRQADVIREKHS